MSIEDRLNKFKDYGWTYDPVNGIVYSHKKKPVKNTNCRINGKIGIQIQKHTLAWYLMTGEVQYPVYHLDNDNDNNKWNNLSITSNFKYKDNTSYKKRKELNHRSGKYLDDVELYYHLIISQGKGELTTEASNLLIRIAKELIKKFNYKDEDDEYDSMMNGLLMLFSNWNHFNSKRFDKCLPYLTEICKRGFAKGFNDLRGKNLNNPEIPKFISLSLYYSSKG